MYQKRPPKHKSWASKWASDTSPSYLLFQTLLPLFWTLICMIWMELTRTDAVFSRIALVLFLCRNKKYWWKNQQRGAHLLSTRVQGAPPALWVPWTSTDLNSNSIYSCSGRKNKKEGFITFYDMEPLPSSVLPREGRSGVRSGLRRGESVAVIIINHPPSPISWCSPPCVSNSIVGLLDGDGLDEIYHVIELVLLGFDP